MPFCKKCLSEVSEDKKNDKNTYCFHYWIENIKNKNNKNKT